MSDTLPCRSRFFFFNFKPKREISFNKTRVPFFCNQISEKFFSLNVRNSRVEYEWRWKCVEASFWLECLVYSTWVTVLQFLAYLVVAYRFLTEFWLLRKCVSVCNWVCVSNCATMSGWCELPFYIGSLVRPEGTLLPTIFFSFKLLIRTKFFCDLRFLSHYSNLTGFHNIFSGE